jgi:hypothetical protein
MVDLGSSGAPNVTSGSRNAAAFSRLHRHAQNCVPIAPDATGGAVLGPNYHKVIYEDQGVRVSGR